MLKLSMLFTDCSNKDSGTDNTTIESLTDTVSIDDNNPNDNLTYVCYVDAKELIYTKYLQATASISVLSLRLYFASPHTSMKTQ